MRVSIVLCALLIPTFAAAADEAPRLKAGEWQYVRLGEGVLNPDDVGTMCLAEQSVLAKFDTISDCISKESHTDGKVTISDAKCRLPYNTLSAHENILRLDDNNLYAYLRATYSPPVLQGTNLEQSEAKLFVHIKWLGACRKGEVPSKYFW